MKIQYYKHEEYKARHLAFAGKGWLKNMVVGVCVGVGVTVFGAFLWASFRMAGIEDVRTERELREKAMKAKAAKEGMKNGQ